MIKENEGLETLHSVLMRIRSKRQDGFHGYRGNGEWDFIATGLPVVSVSELNTLLDFAGIEPDLIEPVGSCDDCKYSHKRGYNQPCMGCLQPKKDRWEPRC